MHKIKKKKRLYKIAGADELPNEVVEIESLSLIYRKAWSAHTQTYIQTKVWD